MGLQEYKRKRKFAGTPEPADGGVSGARRIFVVQLHHASHRHYDFRLELDGVLKSWAVPKGPSFDPSVKRLAMEVEDHPLSYATFQGDIPKGNYGAGHVDVFDHGTWEPIGSAHAALGKGDLKFNLYGDVLRGSWVLVRTRRQGTKNQWLLIKHRDEFAGERDVNAFVDPATDRPIPLAQRKKTWAKTKAAPSPASVRTKSPMPVPRETIAGEAFAPELCKSMPAPPVGDEWLHEVKWDGYRIVTTVVRGKVRLWSRNGIEWTSKLPDLVKAVQKLELKSAQLDGEMIVLREGRDDFNALQARLSSAPTDAPVVYMLFDLPHLNGRALRALPLVDRKAALASLLAEHPHPLLRYSEHLVGNGPAAFAQATASGLEGIVSKRKESKYVGSRNGDWVKSKGRPSDEFIVMGFTEPKMSRAGLGALLLAKPKDGKLVYVGRVGTGFTDEHLRSLRKQLEKDIVDVPAADIALMARADQKLGIWVKPKLVVEAYYQGVGGQGLLRQPAFKAMRLDKTPKDILMDKKIPAKKATKKIADPIRPIKRASAKKSGTAAAFAVTKRKKSELAMEDVSDAAAVTITHPEREVFPGTGITKADVAAYYRAVAPWLLPEIDGRPVSVVRCPGGSGQQCFFQKHVAFGLGKHVHGVSIKESKGTAKYLCIQDTAGLLELVQMNVLELHPWGAKSSDPDRADRIVFDLDPHASVKWSRVVAAARMVRSQMESIGLRSFLKTSGGKGLHVVVPLSPPAPWSAVKSFAQAVSQALVALQPDEFVSVAGEKKREGKIFIDWLRNGRGATSVASYSLRARATAGVAMPLSWDELGRVRSGDAFTIKNALARIAKRASDPWADIYTHKQSLPKL